MNDEMMQVWGQLAREEKEALIVLAKRILAGQRHYGALHFTSDLRDWRKERAEELQDFLIYSAYAEVAAQKKGRFAAPPRARLVTFSSVVWVAAIFVAMCFIMAAALFTRR